MTYNYMTQEDKHNYIVSRFPTYSCTYVHGRTKNNRYYLQLEMAISNTMTVHFQEIHKFGNLFVLPCTNISKLKFIQVGNS